MSGFATHLECSRCGEDFTLEQLAQVCKNDGGPLLVRYDLVRARETLRREAFAARPWTLWRYQELLPMRGDDRVSLGEPITPLDDVPRLGHALGIEKLRVKDEGLLPTGTFKARGAAVGVTRAVELGVRTLALTNVTETAAYGARVYVADGQIDECGALVGKGAAQGLWFDCSTLKEPYRLEGKKVMGFELAEQLGWRVPDVIVYPTGGGVGLIGMWKAFSELGGIGWLDGKRPRFVAAQAEGCAPIVRAFAEGRDESDPWPDPRTFAAGIRVPKALGDFIVLRALRETNGTAVAVTDADIARAMRVAGEREGMLVCPEGAAALAAAGKLRGDGWIGADDEVVVFNTGTGLLYGESLQGEAPRSLAAGELPGERRSGR